MPEPLLGENAFAILDRLPSGDPMLEGADLRKVFLDGKLVSAQVGEELRKRWRPQAEAKFRRWLDGSLFMSQRMVFDQWIGMQENAIKQEWVRGDEARHVIELGTGKSWPREVAVFINQRILEAPGFEARQKILGNKELYAQALSFWQENTLKHKWNW